MTKIAVVLSDITTVEDAVNKRMAEIQSTGNYIDDVKIEVNGRSCFTTIMYDSSAPVPGV